jgi:hypothetical protein
MRFRLLCLFFFCGLVAVGASTQAAETAEVHILASELAPLRKAQPGEELRVVLQWRSAAALSAGAEPKPIEVRLRRIEVYAPDARVLEATAHGYRELPRDARLHFVAEPSAGQRMSLSFDPASGAAEGLFLHGGRMFALAGSERSGALVLEASDMEQPLADGSRLEASCSGDMGAASDALSKSLSPSAFPLGAREASVPEAAQTASRPSLARASFAPKLATRQVTLAIDTDNELLQKKFNNNTSNATAYVAALVAAMNAIYEDDPAQYGLQLRLLQGTLILRPSTTTDPFLNTDSSATNAALNEFGAWWRDNQAAVPRAFALKLSGKGADQNSSSGIAWLLTSGSYCAATGSTGAQVFGHYSVTRVFWNPGFGGAQDAYVVAHELGHNLGARHTHCANATTGAQASTGTIDRCFSGESGLGCYAGTQVCPSGAESPLAPQGTLMSYCHLNGLSCGVSTELHPTHVTQLNARLASQPSTCLVPIGSNQAPTINAPASISGVEDTVLALTGISVADPDSASLAATFSVPSGALNATAAGGVSVSGSASARVLTGSPSALNSFLSEGRLSYAPVANANGNVTLGLSVTDTVAAPVSRSVTLAMAAVNDAPTLNAPASLSVQASVSSAISGVSYADVDSPGGGIAVQASYSAGSGSFTASSGGGVTVSGSGSGSLTLSGTLSAINSFVAATPVRFTASPTGPASVSLSLGINDLGNTGSGGALEATRSISVSVSGREGELFANGFEP